MTDAEDNIRFVLDYLGHELDPSILIGGWATHHRVGGDISRDIDLIVTEESRFRVASVVEGVDTSTHLQGRKRTGDLHGVHIDVYEPYQSRLGQVLQLRVEVLAEHVDPHEQFGPWRLLTLEAHILSKLAALLDRPETEKGEKDAREVDRLLREQIDPAVAIGILFDATAASLSELPDLIDRSFQLIAQNASVNRERRRELDRLRAQWRSIADDELRSRQPGTRPPI
jgi:hypothetical protein